MFEEELHGPPPLVQQHTSMVLSVEVVHIEIGDALSEGFGPRRFTSYRLTSTVRENVLNAFGGGELTLASGVTCRRRFNGFLKLRAELLEAWPGVIIPPLPEKQTVGRFDPEFVEKRRRALASFLGACATHPLLCACPLLHSFCEWPAALRSTVLQCAPTQYVPSAEEFNRTGSGEPLKSALNDIDAFALQAAKLRDVLKREHVRDLERSVDLMELAQAYGSFGTSDFNFALRPLLAKASQTMGVLSTLAKLQAEADQKALLNTLKEYKHICSSIAEQCRRREVAAKAVESVLIELKAAQFALAKAVGRAGVERKAADLEAKVAECRGRAEGAQARLALHARTLSVELSRFHATKNGDFARVLRQLSAEHARSTAATHEQWRQLLAELGSVPGTPNGHVYAPASNLSNGYGGARQAPGSAGGGFGGELSFMQALQQHTSPPATLQVPSAPGAFGAAYGAEGALAAPVGGCGGSPRGLAAAQQYSPPVV